jgi:hypothetical protein
MLKIRARKFAGRCSRHKSFNPAIDGPEAVRGNCARCLLLADIYQSSLKLNELIRQLNPSYDDLQRPASLSQADSNQMNLLDGWSTETGP